MLPYLIFDAGLSLDQLINEKEHFEIDVGTRKLVAEDVFFKSLHIVTTLS